ncbi:hypothetical protein V474_01075 [Novosphingobium barchaimii LL02]|uniref:Uncharacterized protein n=1 Tax=Novosphingobium barchaimii LL02 TaxID=1114963 RepID=A0A0J7YAD9_9SPHN|nr:hypothetical protein [Novosphingobium barchaimii]KMS60308.1 hypothetical protein V474_01075 [Novosphingobium barchaimii LL02]
MLAHKLDEVLPQTALSQGGSLELPAFPQWADAPISAPAEPQQPSAGVLELRRLAEPEAPSDGEVEAWHLPPPGIHTTGSQLRRRLVTAESIAALSAHEKPSLLQRICALLPGRK